MIIYPDFIFHIHSIIYFVPNYFFGKESTLLKNFPRTSDLDL